MRISYLISAFVLASTAMPAQAADVLSNSGFESGVLSPWTVLDGSPVVTSAQAHSGTYSIAELGNDSIMQTFTAVATSDITEVSLWAMLSSGPFDSYTFYYSDSTHSSFILSGSGSSWTKFDLTSNLASGKSLVGFSIYGTTPGPTYLDDFLINVGSAVPEPATWAMMLFGFAAMGIALRRRRPRARLSA